MEIEKLLVLFLKVEFAAEWTAGEEKNKQRKKKKT
jgi:hypothetical protein